MEDETLNELAHHATGLKNLLYRLRDERSSTEAQVNAVYHQRNMLALALATLALINGGTAGIGLDPEEPDWPVLFIELPTGQVSYHLPKELAEEFKSALPEYGEEWDGHTDGEKDKRLRDFINLNFEEGL